LFVTLWEFEVKRGCEELFEKSYGPEGAWVRLFRQDRRYLGTRLFREVGAERVYLTLDCWESRQAYEEFREKRAAEYARIDTYCERITAREAKVGEF
jgi:hypothetical protein